MINVVIYERPHENIAALTAYALSQTISDMPDGILLSPKYYPKKTPELMLISGRAYPGLNIERLRGKIILLPGERLSEKTPPKNVISYGLSPKDAITFSSLTPKNAVLSVQRELKTPFGETVMEQDIPIKRMGKAKAESLLASLSLLIMLGVPPDELKL